MGDCDILRVVAFVLLASCTNPKAGQMSLLPPGQDAGAGVSPTRRPGDPQDPGQDLGVGDSGPPAAADTGPAPAGPEAGPPAAPDTAPPAGPDAAPNLARDAPELAADAAPGGDVGVTWDANLTVTDCGVTLPWNPKMAYAKYEFARNYGHIFQCLGEPPYRLDCKSPDYEPGKPGGPWMEAWVDYGRCR